MTRKFLIVVEFRSLKNRSDVSCPIIRYLGTIRFSWISHKTAICSFIPPKISPSPSPSWFFPPGSNKNVPSRVLLILFAFMFSNLTRIRAIFPRINFPSSSLPPPPHSFNWLCLNFLTGRKGTPCYMAIPVSALRLSSERK